MRILLIIFLTLVFRDHTIAGPAETISREEISIAVMNEEPFIFGEAEENHQQLNSRDKKSRIQQQTAIDYSTQVYFFKNSKRLCSCVFQIYQAKKYLLQIFPYHQFW